MTESNAPFDPGRVSRRGFLKTAGVTVAVGAVLDGKAGAGRRLEDPPILKGETKITFNLNGAETTAVVGTGITLLELLREQLDLTGTKMVCDRGACGACTVHLDGRTVNSCLLLAVDVAGRKVETIESLAKGDQLHPVQQGFVEEDGMQCGFCTPGMVMSCKSLLDHNPNPTRAETAEAISGNICRCGTYFNIFRAVDRAKDIAKGGK